MRLRRAAVLCLVVSTWSCSQASSPSRVEQAIGLAGGRVTNSDGDAVEIPANALGGQTSISLTPSPEAPLPSGFTFVGTPVVLGPEGTQFAQPVTVTLAFDPTLIPAGSSTSQS